MCGHPKNQTCIWIQPLEITSVKFAYPGQLPEIHSLSHQSFQVLGKTGDENDFLLESLFRSHSPYKFKFMSYYTSRFEQPVWFTFWVSNCHKYSFIFFFTSPFIFIFFSVFFLSLYQPNYDLFNYLIYFKIYCSSAIDFSMYNSVHILL